VHGGPNQWFDQIAAVVPGLSGFRQYDNGSPTLAPPGVLSPGGWLNNLATTWPAPPFPGYEGPSVFSIYPVPDSLAVINIGGKPVPQFPETYKELDSLLASAPPNSYLSAWHEFGTIDYSAFDFLDAKSLYGLHQALNDLVADYPNVTYGPILFTPKTQDYNSLVAAFQSVPPGMGFYGVDVYGNNGTCEGLAQLENFIKLAKTIRGGSTYPKLLIAETNTPPVSSEYPNAAPRSGPAGTGWFESVCTRMHNYGANSIGVLTYWNVSGKLSGAWDPGPVTPQDPDGTTVTALQNCIDKIFTATGTLSLGC
jgi:hypothetical protein